MATEVRIPKLGMLASTATLVEWLVDNGAEVTKGTPLYVLETDKSSTEIEAPSSGILEILGTVDTEYGIGDVVARIL